MKKALLIIFILALGIVSFKLVSSLIDYDADVRFCNEQGWGWTSGYHEDSKTIWCGVPGSGGVNYPAYENWYGGYSVQKDFGENEINLQLAMNNFRMDCYDKCREYQNSTNAVAFEKIENGICHCLDISFNRVFPTDLIFEEPTLLTGENKNGI